MRSTAIHALKPILILKTGETYSDLSESLGDFEDWITDGLGSLRLPVVVLDPREKHTLPEVGALAGVIITGSHAMVSDHEPWSERLLPWLREIVFDSVPLLGICFGHQLLAYAFGGHVGYHPRGIEIGTTAVAKTQAGALDPIFGPLPPTFSAHVFHRQAVLRLPEEAVLLASNGFEPHHAFRLGDAAWGVQFHPEFNERAMRAYLSRMADSLAEEGQDATDLLTRTVDTPAAGSLLKHFGDFVCAHQVGQMRPMESRLSRSLPL